MGAEPVATASQGGKRTAKRARVLLAAKLRTSWGEVEAKLRDLSQKGALMECREPLEAGSEVIFSRGRTVVPARVAWAAGGRLGLEFLRPIDQSEVLVQLGRAPAAPSQPQVRCRRPRILGEDMSAEERRLASLWGVQVGIPVSGR
jgi:hypothetical protein